MFIFVYCIRSWWSLDPNSQFFGPKCLGFITQTSWYVCSHHPSIQVGTLCLNLGKLSGISDLVRPQKNIRKMRRLGVHHYMYSLFLLSFLCWFTWYFFNSWPEFSCICFKWLDSNVCRPFTILPKNLDFPSGVFSLRNPGLQQRDGMQFNSARLKVKPWEVSLVFIGHLKKSAWFLTRASAMDTHTHTCQLKFAHVFCRDKWHHVSRNQLLHDKSVGDVSGQVLLPLFLKAPRGEKNI